MISVLITKLIEFIGQKLRSMTKVDFQTHNVRYQNNQ